MDVRASDGRKVFEPQTGLLIPFKSHSDALLAQLPLQHGMSKQHFDLLLDILLDPSFSLGDLNLRNATDVDVRISEHRREMAEGRSRKFVFESDDQTETASSASRNLDPVGMPSVIFELVLDQIVGEMDHFSREADATLGAMDESSTLDMRERQRDLKFMSVVHRTWTGPVQRTLRRRVILTTRRTMREFARSPACGSGVREFAYKIAKAETCTFFHESSVAREHWSTLASVISRLITLRFLCLRIESAHLADLAGLDLVLQAISGLTTLEGLWLESSRDHCPYLPQLCASIPKLSNLRFLSLFNWTCPRRGVMSDTLTMRDGALDPPPPPPRLKALQFRDDYLTTPSAYLSWLFKPCGSYCLDTLDLQITFSRPLPSSTLGPFPNTLMMNNPRVDSSHVLSALAPLLPSILSLAVKLFYLDTSSAAGATAHDTDIQTLLAGCTALRRVRLHRLRAGTIIDGVQLPGASLTAPLVLPPTIEELHMHYTYSAVNWRTQDQRLCGTLKAGALPRLRRVLVSNGEADCEGGRASMVNPAVDLPRTYDLCAKLNIEFVLYEKAHLNQYVVDSLS